MKFRCRQIAIKQISTLLTRNVSKPLLAHNYFSWCKLRLYTFSVYLGCMSSAYMFSHLSIQ